MGTSIIDGTVEEAKLKRARGGFAIYDSIRFQLDDGSSRTVTKMVLKQEVADAIVPGTRGRFYLFSAFDLKGIHGVRRSDGSAVYGFPANNAKLFAIMGVVNVLWIALKVGVDAQVPLLGVGLLGLSVVGYILMNKGQREAHAQFEGDSGHIAAGA